MKKLRVLICEAGKAPRVAEIEDTLKAKQEIVGGYIECIYLNDDVIMVCNEEGKLIGLPYNRPLFTPNGEFYDIVCGDCFIVGNDGEDFRSLTDAEIEEWNELYSMIYFEVADE